MLESSDYPAVYRCARRTQFLNYCIAVVPLAPGVGLLSALLMGQVHGAGAVFFVGLLGLGMLAASGAFLLASTTYTLTLEVDAISWKTVFARRRMERRDIKGYMRMGGQRARGGRLLFLPAVPDMRPFEVGLTPDARFERWLHGLADLNAAESKS